MNLPTAGAPGKAIFGGALIGGIIAAWGQIKIYLLKIYGLFIVRVQIHGQASYAFKQLLWNEFSCSPLGEKVYYGGNEYVRPISRTQLVMFENLPKEPTVWWRKKRFMIVSGTDGDLIKISFIRFMFNRDSLLVEAGKKFNNRSNNGDWKKCDRFFIRRKIGTIGESSARNRPHSDDSPEVTKTSAESSDKYVNRPLEWTRDELGQPKGADPMKHLSLKKPQKTAIDAALLWRNSEKWFKQRQIPWKLGWMFTGIPGTGKTAFARALGQLLNMPIFSFDLPTMTNVDFNEAWDYMMNYTPCFGLFEDIDGVFHGRKNIAVQGGLHQGLSFDCFLQKLDGVENTDGMFTIVTTNDESKVDPAIGNIVKGSEMSTRPGRIDRIIRFEPLDRAGRLKMAERICEGLDRALWGHLLEDGKKDTGAQFQYRCCQLAGKIFWEKQCKLL